MEWTTTREAGQSHGLKILIHGPAGSGKTRLMGTTGDPEGTAILSAEAGLLSLRNTDLRVAIIRDMTDMREAYGKVKAEIEEGTLRWLGLDSLSEIAETCLAQAKEDFDHGLKAYGEMADIMFRLIRRFRDLSGVHVVMTAKQERVNDDGRLVYVPSLPGKQLGQGISYLFDEVFALRATRDAEGDIKRFIQTVNDGSYEAKDRSGALEPAEKPSLEHIAGKIQAATDAAPGPDENE